MHVVDIRVDQVDPPAHDDRIERSPEDIAALAADIEAQGLIHPIAVRALDGRYECVAGWSRVLAHRELGRATIGATVHHDLTPQAAARLRLAENLQRQNLSPIEEALRVGALAAEPDTTVHTIAELVHRTPEWVAQRLELLAIPDDLQALVHDRSLAIGAALWLARVTDAQHRAYLTRYAVDGGATIASVRAWVLEWQMHRDSGAAGDAPLPPPPVLHQPTTVYMPCARCHASHDVRVGIILRVCPECAREVAREMKEKHDDRPHPE